jgi:hypothetical protein
LIDGGDLLYLMQSAWSKANKVKDAAKIRSAAEFILRAQLPAEPIISRLRELSRRPAASFPWENGCGATNPARTRRALARKARFQTLNPLLSGSDLCS